jgi:hypothetical protein
MNDLTDEWKIPEQHPIFKIGPLSYYWLWINEGTEHQHRGFVLNWHTRKRMIYLTDWTWWRPFKLFPLAMIASLDITNRR